MKKLLLLTVIGAFMLVASTCWAEIPHLINYQGMLTDNAGNPITEPRNLTFTIYDAPTSGTALWTETHTAVPVENGLFNVILGGATTPIPDSVFDSPERYLGIKVETDPELVPRIQLTSVGYAYRALTADSATVAVSAPTGGGWTDDGTIVRLENGSDSVGIGITSPVAKLDVNGDINTSSLYRIGGDTVLSVPGYNTLVGVEAGANNTNDAGTFMGYRAGYNNSGFVCTFVGYGAGFSNQGYSNTFMGVEAGASNTTGHDNTFSGYHSGKANTTGYVNTFLGSTAGYSNTTGWGNTFTGDFSGGSNTTGYHNTYLGYNAGSSTDTGKGNTFVGAYAGDLNTDGNENTYLGASAGHDNVSGSRNVFIGYQAGFYETGTHKLIIANSPSSPPLIYGDFLTGRLGLGTTSPSGKLDVVGNYIRVAASTDPGAKEIKLRTDGAAVDVDVNNADLFIKSNDGNTILQAFGGNVGIGTNPPTQKLDVNGTARLRGISDGTIEMTGVVVDANGVLYKEISPSSIRYKKNIREIEIDPENILKLQTVRFEWKESGKEDVGLIAEEVEKAVPDLVIYNDQGRPNGVRYDKLALYLLETVKELKSENDALRSRIEVLESRE